MKATPGSLSARSKATPGAESVTPRPSTTGHCSPPSGCHAPPSPSTRASIVNPTSTAEPTGRQDPGQALRAGRWSGARPQQPWSVPVTEKARRRGSAPPKASGNRSRRRLDRTRKGRSRSSLGKLCDRWIHRRRSAIPDKLQAAARHSSRGRRRCPRSASRSRRPSRRASRLPGKGTFHRLDCSRWRRRSCRTCGRRGNRLRSSRRCLKRTGRPSCSLRT